MVIKRILSKEFLSNFFFGKISGGKLEDRLILLVSFVGAVLSLISLIGNYLLGLSISLISLSGLIFLAFLMFFTVGRFYLVDRKLYVLVSITSVLYLNLAWFFNYGSKGPILSLFIILYAFFIFIWERKMIVVISIIIFLNIFLLLGIEFITPDSIGGYVNESTRKLDVYLGIIIALILIMSLSVLIKKHHEKEYQEARKADQLKSAFLENMSHEIRTPLNAIVGFSSIIAEPDFNNQSRDEFKDLIEVNSDYLLHFIEDIVDLSKLEADVLNFKITKTNLIELFDKLQTSFMRAVSMQHRYLKISCQHNIKNAVIETDMLRLEQVFRSLINNAIKFTKKGEIVFGCEESDDEFTFFVRDTGIGVRPENIDQIFERFVKIDEVDDELVRGTGVGLYLSKEIIEKLGGRIWVESEFGKGTTIFFTLMRS